MKIAFWLLRCYPRRWRERYQEEMLALLEQHRITPKTVIDLFLGALDARLHSVYRSKGGLLMQQIRDNRSLAFIYLCALAVFLLANSFSVFLIPQHAIVFNNIMISGIGFNIIEFGVSVMSLIALLSKISVSVGKAYKQGQWGIVVFALICLGITLGMVWLSYPIISHSVFTFATLSHIDTLIETISYLLGASLFGGGLFLIGVNGLKLLRERLRLRLLSALLLWLLPTVICLMLLGLFLPSVIGISSISLVPLLILAYLTGPYLALGGLWLTLATGPITRQGWQNARVWGLIMIFLLLVRFIILVMWSVSIWIINPLIFIELALALALALMFLAILRSFLIPAEGSAPLSSSGGAEASHIPS